MATDDWETPEDEAAEQAVAGDDEDATEAGPRPDTEADEADSLEQIQELPEDDEYRED